VASREAVPHDHCQEERRRVRITLPDGVTFTPGEGPLTCEPEKGRGSPKNPAGLKRLGTAHVNTFTAPSPSLLLLNNPAMPRGYFCPQPRLPKSSLILDGKDIRQVLRLEPPTASGAMGGGPPSSPSHSTSTGPTLRSMPAPRTPPKPLDGPASTRADLSSGAVAEGRGNGQQGGREHRDTGFFLPSRSLSKSPTLKNPSTPSR
jgi:hypothetical protein